VTVTFLLSLPKVLTSQFFEGFIWYPNILIISFILVARHEIIHCIVRDEVFCQ